nr:deoxyribose-phosphate aldolase [Streptococcus thermophilus]
MTQELAWLAPQVGRDCVTCGTAGDSGFAPLVGVARAGHIVEPTSVAAQVAQPNSGSGCASVSVVALVGWPTGRHHSLIKAAEARLAMDEGAAEVWVSIDETLLGTPEGMNAVLADIIAVRQVIDARARLGVTCSAEVGANALGELDTAAHRGGVDLLAIELRAGEQLSELSMLSELTCETAVFGRIPTLDAALDLLLAGAGRVFV